MRIINVKIPRHASSVFRSIAPKLKTISILRPLIYFPFFQTNKLFQTNDNDPVKLLESLVLLIKGLAQRVVVAGCRADLLKVNIRDYLHPRPHLGYLFEDKMRQLRSEREPVISVDEEMVIRKRCVDFLVTLVSQLQQRLPDNVEVLEKVSMLSPTNCLRATKQPIIPVAELVMTPREIIAKIDFQWSKLSFVEWNETSETVLFWEEVSQYKDAAGENPFKELAEFANICLVLPWSNGEVERGFSDMNVVKTPHRNNLRDTTLLAILTIRAGLRRLKKCCSTYVFPPDVLEKVGTNAAYEKPADGKYKKAGVYFMTILSFVVFLIFKSFNTAADQNEEDVDIDDVLMQLERFEEH